MTNTNGTNDRFQEVATSSDSTQLGTNKVQFACLANEANARAEEFEEARQISADFIAKIKSAGLYRMLVPSSVGGLGMPLLEWSEVVQTFSAADASTGWVIGHGSITSAIIHACASDEFAEEFFHDQTTVSALSNLSMATAVPQQDGYVVTGSWGFVSGCLAADYIGGMVRLESGQCTTMMMQRSDVAIRQDWNPMGIAGSGSHSVTVENLFVPKRNSFEWPRPATDLPTSAQRGQFDAFIPGTWLISIIPAAVHLGIARRALSEVSESLANKKDAYSGRAIIENPSVLKNLEQAQGLLMLCESAFKDGLKHAWQASKEQRKLSIEDRRQLRLRSVSVVQKTYEVVSKAFQASGAAGISKASPIQRIYRDASCLINHVSTNEASYEVTGRAHHGLDQGYWL